MLEDQWRCVEKQDADATTRKSGMPGLDEHCENVHFPKWSRQTHPVHPPGYRPDIYSLSQASNTCRCFLHEAIYKTQMKARHVYKEQGIIRLTFYRCSL